MNGRIYTNNEVEWLRLRQIKLKLRTLELLQIFKAALDTDSDYVEVRKADFDWMQTHLKEHAHKFWAAPDSAFLRKWLEDNTTDRQPDDSPNGVAKIAEEESVAV